ncbi:glycosyltransferase family 61 protein [Acidisphaera rubrifaciens]|uniref:Glycosyltransferase 61 catalytic domain-containing protein n=1 Tax=Acidisphaera rubrifaciens HS-AP3 TaxID=1231350 RepID=A0A0D6P6L8_9PROT|nr:glycosyltransferase family 61 protein [Acidisphaera rubrifaciens]GAN77302.1 hypothetical protein Asru_0279_04 [Acidisphaera rubrifaciens HS-AP3]
MTARRLAEAADRIVIVDPKRPVRPPPSMPALDRPQTNPFIGDALKPMRVRHYLLRDAVLDATTMILLSGEARLRETAYCLGEETWGAVRVHDPAPPAPGTDRVVIGANLWAANYFHWVVQSLPAIDAALRRRDRSRRPVSVALHAEAPFQTAALEILGWGDVPRLRLEMGRQYALPLAEYSEFLSGEPVFGLSASEAATFARLRAAIPLAGRPRRRIYVARTDAAARRMRSEAALIDRLAAAGFEIVVPGALTFRQQAALFREARLVVGAHGAGMTNIVFCEPGAVILELMPAHNVNGCYRTVAALCGLRYWADAYPDPSPGGDGPPHVRDWDLDVDHVAWRAAAILRHLGDI